MIFQDLHNTYNLLVTEDTTSSKFTLVISTLFCASVVTILKVFVSRMEVKKPLKDIPMAPSSHWWLGHANLFFRPDFEKTWHTLAYENANEDGICSFWVKRKPIVTVTKAEHARAICIAGSIKESTPSLTKHMAVLGGEKGLLLLNGKEWKLYRSIISRAFISTSVESMLTPMISVGRILVKSITMKCEELENTGKKLTYDLDVLFQMYTIDVLGRTLLGKDFQCCELLKYNKNVQEIEFLSREFIRRIGSQWNIAARYYSLPTRQNRAHRTALKNVRCFVENIIKEHRKIKAGKTSDDKNDHDGGILSALLELGDLQAKEQSSDPESTEEMINDTIIDNVLTLYRAGFLTVGSMLMYTMYRLCLHSEVEATCLEEVTRVMNGNNEKIDPEDFPYLRAVLNETLRLHPTGYALNRTLEKPMKINDVTIPKGIHVFMPIYHMQRDEQHFPRALDFIPERWTKRTPDGKSWMDRSMSDDEKMMKVPFNIPPADHKKLLAFSAGGRNCVGEKMARQEMCIVMAMLIRNFKFELVPGYKLRPARASATQKPKDGMPMIISKRE